MFVNKVFKYLVYFTCLFLISTCIDPYYPMLEGYNSRLVVEGLLTDENIPDTIKLSRTMQSQKDNRVTVSDAIIYISDETDKKCFLTNKGNGVYITDNTQFRGEVGKIYKLHIKTSDGEEFESTSCPMLPVPEIDSVYFIKDDDFSYNSTEYDEGLRILLDTKPGDAGTFCRWSYEETWKFRIFSPKKYIYVDADHIYPIKGDSIFATCFKNSVSNKILINAILSGQSGKIERQPIYFIATGKTDRVSLEYSILVKQYSISATEYTYWKNMKTVSEESGGDIFALQPYSFEGNIHNITQPGEKVLGYFEVSSVKSKRSFLYHNDVLKMDVPNYKSDCERIIRGPSDYPGPGYTFDEIYNGFPPTSGYEFVEPLWDETGHLDKLVFAKFECADCKKTGTPLKPQFWPD